MPDLTPTDFARAFGVAEADLPPATRALAQAGRFGYRRLAQDERDAAKREAAAVGSETTALRREAGAVKREAAAHFGRRPAGEADVGECFAHLAPRALSPLRGS